MSSLSYLPSLVTNGVNTQPCVAATFSSIPLYGGEIKSVNAVLVNATAQAVPDNYWPLGDDPPTTEVCNVTITYTHPGWDDLINTMIYLPVSVDWNGRLLGTGGGGWVTGYEASLRYPPSEGWAVVGTDGGHNWNVNWDGTDVAWQLESNETISWPRLVDFASVSLDDAATLGKEVTAAFYGSAPKKSYFTGCSTGGRQGHMLAQRYPHQYDGIVASAAAINWDKFIVSEYWPILSMRRYNYVPSNCELNAITAAAVAACDELDGVIDGIIIDESICHFDPQTVVGQQIQCPDFNNQTITISKEGALVAAAIWSGPRTQKENKFQWYGLNPGTKLTGLGNATCTSPSDCEPKPFSISENWLRNYVSRNKSIDLSTVTWAEYESLFRQSVNQYSSVIGTSDPDLTDFKNLGHKLITWHGTSDELIPPGGTTDYYDRVLKADAKAADYYRYFQAPGVGHCYGGEGYFPGDVLKQIVEWVEKGIAPDSLTATNIYAEKSEPGSKKIGLCPYPQTLKYAGSHSNQAESWICQDP